MNNMYFYGEVLGNREADPNGEFGIFIDILQMHIEIIVNY